MKILQIFNRYEQFGGEEACVTEMESALREKHEVFTYYGSTREMLGTGLMNKVQAPLKAIWNPKAYAQLRSLQASEKYDAWLVHNVFPGLSPSVYDAARRSEVPVIQYLHNYRFTCVNGFLLNHGEPCQRCLSGNFLPAVATRCWHESRAACATMGLSLTRLRAAGVFNQVAHWIAISEAQKAIHTRIGIPERKISVVYHFFEGSIAERSQGGADLLFVGRLSPEKGVGALIKAWVRSPVQGRKLIIAGDGPLRSELEKEAAGRNDVQFTGFLTGAGLEAIWKRAALTVVPSIWEEPFGRVVLESWAAGVPVLAARVGALPELIEKSGAGWLFEPKIPEDLSLQLGRILSDQASLLEAATKAHSAVRRFDRATWMKQVEEVLQTAVIPSC